MKMKVYELEEFLKTVKDKNKLIFFYSNDDNPLDYSIGVENAFEISKDVNDTGGIEGLYLKGE